MDLGLVREVCPLVRLKPAPGGPAWLAGLLDYHGQLLPAVDASHLLGGAGVPQAVGARMILMHGADTTRTDAAWASFALRVSAVEGVAEVDRGASWAPADGLPDMPFLGGVMQGPGEGVLLFDPAGLAKAHPRLLHGPAILGLAQADTDDG